MAVITLIVFIAGIAGAYSFGLQRNTSDPAIRFASLNPSRRFIDQNDLIINVQPLLSDPS